MLVDVRSSAIECRGVSKRFGTTQALDGLDLDVRPGTITGFLGPNGAGKSTTMRVLVGLIGADAGHVRVLDTDPRNGDPAVRASIGYLPGELRLDERLTVGATLESWARIRGGVDPARTSELCERLGLDPTRDARGLSSGNRRKVGLVGAFMADPALLILDEPTSGLDPLVQAEFGALLRECRERGRTVLLSSHVLSEVQDAAERVVVIRNGRSAFTGAVDDLRRSARHRFTVRFGDDPPLEALRLAEGVRVDGVAGATVDGTLEGSPDALLRVLAGHHLEQLLLPEPDLEDAFLHLYEDER